MEVKKWEWDALHYTKDADDSNIYILNKKALRNFYKVHKVGGKYHALALNWTDNLEAPGRLCEDHEYAGLKEILNAALALGYHVEMLESETALTKYLWDALVGY